MNKPMSRRDLRRQIAGLFPVHGDFDAFILDYWPSIYQGFSGSMSREDRLNILLTDESLLPDIERAIEEEWSRREEKATDAPNAIQKSPPRPYDGMREQEITIDLDLRQLDNETKRNLVEIIGSLQGYKIILRNCRSGSVILHIIGTWQGTANFMEKYQAGLIRKLLIYDIIEIRWVYLDYQVADALPSWLEALVPNQDTRTWQLLRSWKQQIDHYAYENKILREQIEKFQTEKLDRYRKYEREMDSLLAENQHLRQELVDHKQTIHRLHRTEKEQYDILKELFDLMEFIEKNTLESFFRRLPAEIYEKIAMLRKKATTLQD